MATEKQKKVTLSKKHFLKAWLPDTKVTYPWEHSKGGQDYDCFPGRSMLIGPSFKQLMKKVKASKNKLFIHTKWLLKSKGKPLLK